MELFKGLLQESQKYTQKKTKFIKSAFIVQESGVAALPKTYEIKPSFRHYDIMTFLNDILEYRQTVTSLQKSMNEEQASTSNRNSIPSTSSDLIVDDVLTSVDTNDSLSSISPTSSQSKKRKRIDLDEYEETLINVLTQNTEVNPIHGFVLRLAEGLRRLSYKSRSKLEIEFLRQLYEVVEEDEGKQT